MVTIHWTFSRIPQYACFSIKNFFRKCHLVCRSLTYNHFLDQSYIADVCMEPLFWFVDNFTYTIGPIFVVSVIGLTVSVVIIAYWIGIPYWWNRNPIICILLLIVGHWLLLNISFHYYMAVITSPGYPPQGELIPEAVSICKKCISPKPPRTHHCSACNRCILKMDHHCPWINNCVGYGNHRYFFLYMVYMVLGVLFVIVCGFDLAYTDIWLTPSDIDDPELEGHSVKFNQTGALIPVTDVPHLDSSLLDDEPAYNYINPWRRRALVYMALINCGVLLALGMLSLWHSQLISKGETCIEANINKAETVRLKQLGKTYSNPYNFGRKKNWKIFLGLVQGRTFVRHVLFPSAHKPLGDGLKWHTIHDEDIDEWP
ncbi:palmitoyltransferase ZDHHC16B isoform X1 [Diorhabda carinulata]|uniref:palmitoyltransferase ZDHHC16B isoform X1 n=1 Tax=Diorhabda carinulata TaxID=1163345 RepID=UPI0025A188C6|nr:palmitoyltransferase ZDHHC16B isoform X1 [Diorhabda carinulata]